MIYKRIVKLLNCYITRSKRSNSAQQYINCKPEGGFTLIELLVVISISAVLGTVGIAGFTTFNQNQVLEASANDLATVISLAKSRAQSQVKFDLSCNSSNETLEGYSVDIDILNKKYSLYIRCLSSLGSASNIVDDSTKTLPSALLFNDSSGIPPTTSTSFFFPVIVGGVQGAGNVVISGYGKTKTVKVNALGGVSVE